MNNPPPADSDALITAIRARVTVVSQKHTTWASRPASPRQLQVLNIALQTIIGNDRDDRIRILRAIFPEGVERGEDGEVAMVNLSSSSHLTVAQASVLMELLFRLTSKDSFYVGRPLYQRAIDFFTAMSEWAKGPAEQLELFSGEK